MNKVTMADKVTQVFQPSEPPVHPQGNPVSQVVQPEVVQAQNQAQAIKEVAEVPKPPRKGVLKKLIFFGLFFVILLTMLAFVATKLKPASDLLFGKKGEIVWWGMQHDKGVYSSIIEEFEKENPNIKIIYEKQSPRDYRERLTNSLASGKGPDVFEIHNSWLPMFKTELATLPTSVMGKEEFDKSFYPSIVANLTTEKGIVAMPLEYDALTLFINEDIFAASLQRPPETWDELKKLVDPREEKSLTIRERDGKIIQSGIALGETSNIDHWPEILALMMFQNRVNPSNPSGQKMADVLTFYTDFRRQNVWDDTLPASTTAFAQGKLAMYFGPTARAIDIAKNNPKLRFKTVRLPQLPKNTPSDPNYSYNTFWVQSVWERSSNKEAAWILLKFLAEKGSLQEINQNIKKHETLEKVYPRPEMNISLREDDILGSIIALGLESHSWYLADNTFDGNTGINSQLKAAFGGVVNEWSARSGEKALNVLQEEVQKILIQYGVSLR